MSNIEECLFNNILDIIKDNLSELIINNDNCLYHFKDYCDNHKSDLSIPKELLTLFTEECLYALLNADFLYNFKDSENSNDELILF